MQYKSTWSPLYPPSNAVEELELELPLPSSDPSSKNNSTTWPTLDWTYSPGLPSSPVKKIPSKKALHPHQ